MSDEEQDPKLVLRAEEILAGRRWIEPDWDDFEARVATALKKSGPTDDSLLLPPLPESVEDDRENVGPAPERAAIAVAVAPAVAVAIDTPRAADDPEEEASASQRDGASLADLARAAIARRGTKEAVGLAKESLAIAAQGRVPVEPTIELHTERERRTLPPVRRARPAFDTRGPWIGVAVAAVGLAAGFGLYLTAQRRTPALAESPVVQVAAPTAPPAQVAAAEARPVTPEMLPAEQRAPAAPGPAPVSLEALAREPVAAKASSPAGEAHTPAAVTGGAQHAEKVVLEEERPASAKTTGAAPKPAATPAMRPAELNAGGGVSDRPSTGAAQAAVGAVLGAARGCIAGQPQGSSATIVFGSGGEVTSVSVSGPAQGTPAAGCIQSALSKARVQPFAASSFSLGVTVRPL